MFSGVRDNKILHVSEKSPNTRKRSTPPSRIQSLDRAVAVLNSFTPERAQLGVTEIARLTGLTRGTAHRIVANLESHQLLQRVQPGNRYALGPGLLRLAHSARVRINLQECAGPIMTRLRDETNETVGLHVVDGRLLPGGHRPGGEPPLHTENVYQPGRVNTNPPGRAG